MKRLHIISWLIINSAGALGLLLTGILFDYAPFIQYPGQVFLFSLVMFNSISFSCEYASRVLAGRLLPGPFWRLALIAVPVSLLIGAVITLLIFALPFLAGEPQSLDNFFMNLKITLFITFVISLVANRLAYLEYEKAHLNEIIKSHNAMSPPVPGAGVADGLMTAVTSEESVPAALEIRDGDSLHYISPESIVYVSAHGSVCVLHTNDREYRVPVFLKEIAGRLPAKQFVRVHRGFIMNLGFLSHIVYHQGGSYLAYLKDSESTILPVGRRFAPLLKQELTART